MRVGSAIESVQKTCSNEHFILGDFLGLLFSPLNEGCFVEGVLLRGVLRSCLTLGSAE